jgi:pyridoxal phosphate enzyme (YggS family)
MRAAAEAGARCFGENYVQEWRGKRDALADLPDVEWHFIGRLQRNKMRDAVGFTLVHSVADARVGAALSDEAVRRGRVLPVLLQVRLGGEATKAGVAPVEVTEAVRELRALPGLALRGLMTIPPPLAPEDVRPLYRELRAVRDAQARASELPELSMGMSADFEVAIEEGATLVRVGTAVFGPRAAAGSPATARKREGT